MKLFKILIFSIIALLAAVFLSGTLTGCQASKKLKSHIEAKSDTLSLSESIALRIDSAAAVSIRHRIDSLHAVSTNDYDRKTIVEEYVVPADYEENGPIHNAGIDRTRWLMGDSALAFWNAGHGLLKKRTITWDKGRQTKTETSTSNTADSNALTSHHLQADVRQDQHQGSRVETYVQQTKKDNWIARGWWITIVAVVVIVGLLCYLFGFNPLLLLFRKKSNTND